MTDKILKNKQLTSEAYYESLWLPDKDMMSNILSIFNAEITLEPTKTAKGFFDSQAGSRNKEVCQLMIELKNLFKNTNINEMNERSFFSDLCDQYATRKNMTDSANEAVQRISYVMAKMEEADPDLTLLRINLEAATASDLTLLR